MNTAYIFSPRHWKFQRQLAVLFTTGVLCFSVLISLINSWQASSRAYGTFVDQGLQVTRGFARQSTLALLYGLGENAAVAARATLGFTGIRHVAVYDREHVILLQRGEEADWRPGSDGALPRETTLVHETPHAWHFVAPVYDTGDEDGPVSPFDLQRTAPELLGYVHVVLGKQGLWAMRREIFIGNFTRTLFSAALMLLLLRWLTLRLIRPLDDLARLMKQTEGGEAGLRAVPRGPQEVLRMGQAFNNMMAVLEERAARLDLKGRQLRQEIEERRQAEAAASRTSARLRHLIESSPTVIYSSVPSGDFKITYVSENITRILGYAPRETTESPDFWHDHIHPDDRMLVFARLPRLFQHGFHVHEYRFRHKQGEYRWIHDQLRIVRDAHGEPLEIVGSLTDCTERKEAELQLIEYRDHLQEMVDEQTHDLIEARDKAQAGERAMSAFLANMSHELRTPLHGILSFANFGIKKTGRVPEEKLRGYFTEIHDSGHHLLGLVNDLLDLSKLRAGKMVYDYQEADIGDIIHAVVRGLAPLAEEKGIRIDIRELDDAAPVLLDAVKILQVVKNLISNALKFSPQGSVIEVTMERKMDGVVVSVADRGVGIPDDEIGGIFEAFTQSSKTRTQAGGTGLGLAICSEIVVAGHHGWIRAANRPGGGARFTFCISAPPLEERKRPAVQLGAVHALEC